MGTVHKFKRPPKNERQFQGYRPTTGKGLIRGKSSRRQLRSWQKTLIAWTVVIALAVGIWAIGKVL